MKRALALASALALAACSAASPPPASTATTAAADQTPSSTTAPNQASTAVAAADAATRTAPVVPGRPGRVFIFAGVDDACKPLPPPALNISRAPAKGDVSFKDGQETVIAASARGTCTGTKAKGTGVYYTARDGMSGPDNFAITARMPTGETLDRAFSVTIAP